MCLKDQNNKIALIIGGGCIGMQIALLIEGIEKSIKERKNKDKQHLAIKKVNVSKIKLTDRLHFLSKIKCRMLEIAA